jgi:hypothetical protein
MAKARASTKRAASEAQAKRRHDERSGKATASASDRVRERKRGNETIAPKTKGRATRDRSDNKKVQSGR